MSVRLINPFIKITDDNNQPLSGGKLFFYEVGTTTLKDTYSDEELTTPNTNPVILDTNGNLGDVYLSGSYRCILKDASDNQLDDKDNINGGASGQLSNWAAGNEYNAGDLVTGSDTKYYASITNANSGNDPVSSPANWEEVRFLGVWNTNISYDAGIVVTGSDGRTYTSVAGSNSGNDPTTSPASWNPSSKQGNPTLSQGTLTNFRELTVLNTSSTNVDVDAEAVMLATTNGDHYEATSVNLSVDITTSGANGLDTGSEAVSTWYYIWVIYNGSTVAGLLSTSRTAPTMPSGYTFKGLVGAVYNDSGSDFDEVTQYNRNVMIGFNQVLSGTGNNTRTAIDLSAVVPDGSTEIFGTTQIGNNQEVTIYPRDTSSYVAKHSNASGATDTAKNFRAMLYESQTIYYNSGSSDDPYIRVLGYVW